MFKRDCAECGTRVHRPLLGWSRVFCTAACKDWWAAKHSSIARGYALVGL